MEKSIKETTIIQVPGNITEGTVKATDAQTLEYIIYFIFGALDTLLAFRLILKLAGASMSSSFVEFIYALSGLFIIPFEGIFRKAITQGIETTSVLEPATMIAIAVYALIAGGIVNLTRILSKEKQIAE